MPTKTPAPRGKAATKPVDPSPTAGIPLTDDEVAAIQTGGRAAAEAIAFADVEPAIVGTAVLVELAVDLIDAAPNVRDDLGDLSGLTESIAAHGVISPIVVTPAEGRFLLVYGQRRLAAAKAAGLERIPSIVDAAAADRRLSEVATIQLVENLQRLDLNPIERAKALRAIVDAGTSQADLARRLGIGASSISNDLRLLGLAEPVQAKVSTGEITASHAKAIAALPDRQQESIAKTIVERSTTEKPMSSHELEQILKWKTDEATSDEARVKRTEKVIPKAIAVLEAAGIERGTAVDVTGSAYAMDVDAARKAIVKAGWPSIDHRRRGYGTLPEGCDCTALQLDLDGRKPKLEKVCVNDKHYDRQVNVDQRARKAEEARLDALVDRLVAGLTPALEALPQPVLALFAWRQIGGTWAEILALPAPTLAAAVAKARVGDYWIRRDEAFADVVEAVVAPAPVAAPATTPATAPEAPTDPIAQPDTEEPAPAGLDGSPETVVAEPAAVAEPVVLTTPAPKPAASPRRRR